MHEVRRMKNGAGSHIAPAKGGLRRESENQEVSGVSVHEPVLLHEIVAAFTAKSGAGSVKQGDMTSLTPHPSFSVLPTSNFWYLDGTLGGAGHALAIAKAFGGKLSIIGLDRDQTALMRAEKTLAGKAKKLILECENFRNMGKIILKHNIKEVNLILLDLGISSDELDNSGRGFTFKKNEPLLMTLGDPKEYPFTAKDILNGWEEEVIADVIFGYGEEKFARRIARNIVNYRQKKLIETTDELVELVRMSVPTFYKRGKTNPATKTFQALRIAVNDELNSLKDGLKNGYEILSKGGRMAVISFHSLEDRIVKEFFRGKISEGVKIITKKPIMPSLQEIAENPRSRSAKLRIIEK